MRVEVVSKDALFFVFFGYEDIRDKQALFSLTDLASHLARKRGFEPDFIQSSSFQQFISNLRTNNQYAIIVGRDESNEAVVGWKSWCASKNITNAV